MDKLQPILKHHFWILLVPLFSMNLWGYYSANRDLKSATEARQKELDSVKSGIPAGTTDPNTSYSEELKKTNDVLVSYVDKELLELWNRQKKRMVWPPRVVGDIPKVYKSDIKSRKTRLTYQNDYPDIKKQVFEIVEPYVADRRGITWTPKVDFPIEFINPYVVITPLAMDSTVMWEAQEDLWLTQMLLEAIREVNKGADSESSAMVRKVVNFRLLGGNGESSVMPSAEGGESEFSGDEEGNGPRRPMGPTAAISTYVAFDPSEEFGTGGDPSQVGVGGNGMMPSLGGDEEEVDAEAPTGPLRYVKEDEAAPFVQRGFYMSVIINQNKMVDFLVALSNSEWPIQVVRFHFGKNPYGGPDPFTSRGGGGSPAGGALGGFADDDDGEKSRRGGGGGPRPMMPQSRPAMQDGEGGFGFGRGGGGGRIGAMPGAGVNPGSTGYPPDALLHPDLVQLDLAGLITIYRQPKSEIPEEGATPEGEATPAEAVEGEMASEDAAVPAEEGDAAAADQSAKSGAAMEQEASADKTETDAAAADEFATEAGTSAKPATDAPAAEPAADGEAPAATPAGDVVPAEGDPAADGAAADEFSSPEVPQKEPEQAPEAPAASEKPSTP